MFSDSYGGTGGRVGIPRRGWGRAHGGGRSSLCWIPSAAGTNEQDWLANSNTHTLSHCMIFWLQRPRLQSSQSPQRQPFTPSLGFQRGPHFRARGPSLASLLRLLPQHISFWTLLPASYRRPQDLTWSSQRCRAETLTESHLQSPCVLGCWVSRWASVG